MSELPSPYYEGKVLLIDKPLHWTSFQVVNKVRWAIRQKYGIKKIKVGHAGTLDPLASGLLILCTGKMTKEIDRFQGQEKEYTGTLLLGATTPSYDLESEVDCEYPTGHITPEALQNIIPQFTGDIEQYPPIFSAVHIDGKRAYDLARQGEQPEMPARQVHISDLELNGDQFPEVSFRVRCSKGTYIRSLAHDIGKAVDSGAHLTELRRTAIGDFHVDNAITVEGFLSELEKEG